VWVASLPVLEHPAALPAQRFVFTGWLILSSVLSFGFARAMISHLRSFFPLTSGQPTFKEISGT